MTIKPDADQYFQNAEKERDLASRLGEAFDITFRNTRGGLSYWFAEPNSVTRERFGLQKEVLVIYSPFTKTDARVLTAIENIVRAPEFKHRLEKVVFILVHCGAPEETNDLLGSSEDRIIVPILEDELLDPNRGSLFVRMKLVEAIGGIDLFGMTSPITSDKYFFGRSELVQAIVNRTTVSRENSGVFGLRKTGKTSVLRAIQRRLDTHPLLSEYIECSNPGIHAARWWEVLENLIERCSATLKRDFRCTAPITGNYTQSNAGSRFGSDVRAILHAGQLDQLLLLFDEIEYVTSGLSGVLGQHWDSDFLPFWQTLRSIHQETSGGLVFLVAGVNPACVEASHFNGIQNPIFQLTAPHYLEPFTVQQTREMVRSIGKYTGLKFTEPTYAYLGETYGGHPFLIRVACSEVWKVSDRSNPEKLTTVDDNSFRRSSLEIRSRMEPPIKDILLSLVWWYPEEYDLLHIIASGDAHFVSDYLRQEPGSVFRFAQYGILKKDKLNEFAIADVQSFLKQFGEKYKKEISPFARGDMPPDLLPAIPDLDVIGRLFEQRSDIETKLRKVIVLYLNVKCGYDTTKVAQVMIRALPKRTDRGDAKDMFVGRRPQEVINQLFCLDLKAIISANWEVFGTLFGEKSRFEMNMDTLNIARRFDAHTKPITPEEATEFENSYSWLLTRLSRVHD